MNLSRRRVLTGLIAAPLIVRTSGLLMPVRPVPLVVPPADILLLNISAGEFLDRLAGVWGITRQTAHHRLVEGESDFSLRNRLLDEITKARSPLPIGAGGRFR